MSYTSFAFEQLNSPTVPPNLRDFLTDSHWQALSSGYHNAVNYSNGLVCMLEWGVCFVFCFPCIFCCHGCLTESMLRQEMEKNARTLNMTLFQGRPVFSVMGTTITINTELIGSLPQSYGAPTANAGVAYATAQPMQTGVSPYANYGAPPSKNPYSDPSAPTVVQVATPVAAAVPQEQKTLTVTVPQGVNPGQMLSVVAPDGRTLQVTVGPNAVPGSQITVVY